MQHQQTFTVDRRTNLSYREFVHDYLMPQKPVIIADGLKAWPALTKWTPEFFKTHHGNKQVTVNGKPMRLGDYIDLVLSSSAERPCPYLSGVMVRQQFPEIADDILPELKYTLPDRLRSPLAIGKTKSRLGLPELLISGLGGRFSLHQDALFLLGFVTQIHGDKEFMIFSPSDTPYLYSRPGDEKHSDIVSPFDVDLEKFPLFAKATPARFVLGPGETIFNPAGWWHATKILSPSIAMVISTANASNWSAYADDLARPRPGMPGLFTSAMRAYLSVTGGMLSVQEKLFPVHAD